MNRLRPLWLIFSLLLLHWQISFAADSLPIEEEAEESALATSIEFEQQRLQLTNQIESLQSEYGLYDYRQLEPLQDLTAVLIEAGEFEEAGNILNQHLQLLRTLEGPANLNQLSVVAESIRNDIRRQNWQPVTERFEFLRWLHGQNPDIETAALLGAMKDSSAWHLAAVYFDSPRNRVRHFSISREIQRDMLSIAESEFGSDSEALIPWLYDAALELTRVVAFLRSEDELGGAARQRIYGLEGRSQKSYLLQAYGIVKRIRKIADAGDNLETQAMAMIYVADFQMLRGLGTSVRVYRDAGEKLKQAGVNQNLIDDFFARPIVLPVNQFHRSIEEALAQQAEQGYRTEPGDENADELVHMGDFIAWNESLPFTRRPAMPALAAGAIEELNIVQLVFSINSRGKTLNAKAQEAEPDTARVKRDARDAAGDMLFRPRFVQGKRRRVEDVTMRYLYPPAK